MTFKAKIKHMSDVIELMKEKLSVVSTYHASDGRYFIRFGSQGNLQWWEVIRDANCYYFMRMNHKENFKVVFFDDNNITDCEVVVEDIRQQLENIVHYQFY